MEEAVECRKQKHTDEQNYESAPKVLLFSDEVDGDGELEIEKEMVIAVMKRLEEEISSASPFPWTSSRFLNPNGGSEETCGSTFSDSASTVMASVHTCALAGAMTCLVGGPWPWAVGSGGVAVAVGPSGSEAEEEEEEEWLAHVLGGPGFELEECFL